MHPFFNALRAIFFPFRMPIHYAPFFCTIGIIFFLSLSFATRGTIDFFGELSTKKGSQSSLFSACAKKIFIN